MMKTKNSAVTLTLVILSIASTYFVTTRNAASAQSAVQTKGAANNEFQVGGVLYMQYAGEYRALAYQAFNIAKMSLDADEKTKKKLDKAERNKPRAVVVDLDETILDNSPQQAYLIKNRLPFSATIFTEWVNKRAAKAIPGAVDFLNYANRTGTKVFYVSNRSNQLELAATMDNLKSAGFPDVSNDTVMLRTAESSKEARRQLILQKYRIVLLMGDNLNDFSNVFEKKLINDRFAEVDKAREVWGTRWIALPNVMYGDWELALYDYQNLGDEDKKSVRRESLMQSFDR
jgi:5'-nucleotidase (lipoprotein e(P4) family)